MKTTTERWETEYNVKQDIEDEKSIQEEERYWDYYGFLCDGELCVENRV